MFPKKDVHVRNKAYNKQHILIIKSILVNETWRQGARTALTLSSVSRRGPALPAQAARPCPVAASCAAGGGGGGCGV